MTRLFITALLLASCSSAPPDDLGTIGAPDVPEREEILTVCVLTDDDTLREDMQWAVEYWQEQGEAVLLRDSFPCLVQVTIGPDAPMGQTWGPTDISMEAHRDGGPNGFSPALIVMRDSVWQGANTAWHRVMAAHELGHAMGKGHDDPMPMQTNISSDDVNEWWETVSGKAE